MKILMILPLVLLPIASKSKAESNLPFETITISPFYSNKESLMVVTTKQSYLRVLLFIQNDKNMNVAVIVENITSPGTYTFKYDNSFTRPKNNVFVRYSTAGESHDTPHIERNIVRSSYGYITNNESISSDNTIAIINGDLTYTTKQLIYNFSGFEGIYVPPYFHKIDLSNFKILIPKEECPLFNCSALLNVSNYEGAFSQIDGAGEYVTFPLKLVEKSYGFTFELAEDYYVDPETLTMYDTQISRLTPKTKHIYLPRNEMKNQDHYQCYFQFNEFGIDKDLIIHQFELKADKNIFGDCSNSKYCIVKEQL